MMTIEPTGSGCGAVVKGIDLNNRISDSEMDKLVWALYENRCLVIKNQKLRQKKNTFYLLQKMALVKGLLIMILELLAEVERVS